MCVIGSIRKTRINFCQYGGVGFVADDMTAFASMVN
jgi:hypothetical protein